MCCTTLQLKLPMLPIIENCKYNILGDWLKKEYNYNVVEKFTLVSEDTVKTFIYIFMQRDRTKM